MNNTNTMTRTQLGYFFNSHLAVKIYQKINQYLGVTLSPTYLENALNSFCTEDNKAALQKFQNGEKGFEIGAYYLHLLAELKRSQRLNAEEKLGQLAFLVREWESELSASDNVQRLVGVPA